MKEKIEQAIKTTLVVKNKESIKFAVDKIIELINQNYHTPEQVKDAYNDAFGDDIYQFDIENYKE